MFSVYFLQSPYVMHMLCECNVRVRARVCMRLCDRLCMHVRDRLCMHVCMSL